MIFKSLPERLSDDEIEEMLEAADSDGEVTEKRMTMWMMMMMLMMWIMLMM